MTILMIGSSAARVWFPDWRQPKDLDVFSDEVIAGKADVFWDDRLYSLLGECERAATRDELYTIKYSHIFWDLPNGSWSKHMCDLMKLRAAGAQLIPEWFDTLYAIWTDVHGAKQCDLTMESNDF